MKSSIQIFSIRHQHFIFILLTLMLVLCCLSQLLAQDTFHTTIQSNNRETSPVTNSKTQKKYINKKNKIDSETLKFWEKTLSFGTSGQKRSVINYIKTKRIKEGEKLIWDQLQKEQNLDIKKRLITTLVSFSNAKIISTIIELTSETNKDDIKIFAMEQLANLKYRKSYEHILNYINSDNELLVEAALRTLGETGAQEAVDPLLAKLENEKSDRIRTQIILTLANIKSERALNTFLSIFTNEEEKEINRAYAATGMGYIKNQRSYDILIRHYAKEPPNIKMRIIDALGNLGFLSAIDLLIESLKNDDKNIRIFAIRSLGKLNAVQAIDILEYKKKYDPDYKVRYEAEEALNKLKEEGK